MCNTKMRGETRLIRIRDRIFHRHATHTCVRTIRIHEGNHFCSCTLTWKVIQDKIIRKNAG